MSEPCLRNGGFRAPESILLCHCVHSKPLKARLRHSVVSAVHFATLSLNEGLSQACEVNITVHRALLVLILSAHIGLLSYSTTLVHALLTKL